MEAREADANHHTRDEIDNYAATEELLDGWVSSGWPSSYMIPTIHQSLLNGISEYGSRGMVPREPGQFRKEDITLDHEPHSFFVKGTDIEPVIRDYFRDLDTILKSLPKEVDGNIEEIVKKSAWAYYTFERIHPFLDGNGRTGRIILNRVLMGAGIEKLIFLDSWFDQEREAHLDAMNLTDRMGSLEPLELYIANALSSKSSLESNLLEIESLIDKKEKSILYNEKQQPLSHIWPKFAEIDIAGPEVFNRPRLTLIPGNLDVRPMAIAK